MEHSTRKNINPADPVCGMAVDPRSSEITASYLGRNYYFCAESCREAFEADPNRYLKMKAPEHKSWWGRYLDRLRKANEKSFGGKRPRCH